MVKLHIIPLSFQISSNYPPGGKLKTLPLLPPAPPWPIQLEGTSNSNSFCFKAKSVFYLFNSETEWESMTQDTSPNQVFCLTTITLAQLPHPLPSLYPCIHVSLRNTLHTACPLSVPPRSALLPERIISEVEAGNWKMAETEARTGVPVDLQGSSATLSLC